MNNKYIAGLIVIAVLIGVCVYVQNSHPVDKKPLATTSQWTSSLQEMVSKVDEANIPATTTGWSIYQSKDLRISLSHPSGLLFQDVQNGVNIYADTPENRAYIQDPSKYEGRRPGMFIVAISPAQDPEDYRKKMLPDWPDAITMLFGQKAIAVTGQGMNRWDVILFVRSNVLYEVTIEYGSINDVLYTTFYKILSSITFGQ